MVPYVVSNQEEEKIMRNSFDIRVWSLKQVALWLFAESFEDLFPGVRKSGQRNGPTNYVFSPEVVGGIAPEKYFWRLGVSGFCGRYCLTAVYIESGKMIKLEGAGGQCPSSFPRVVFSKASACLIVPYDLSGNRDWDEIALAMSNLFSKPAEAFP